ncbi:hypothetical protein NXW50_30900 [Bacteroides thetaiotaomicron]|nr:type VI secretion system protein TssR domain-containing protein [Bacteroides thetaiotaomicron]MCS2282376.1 hypothetical protein [Bacteroides thetaiotaomicron]
MKPISLVVIGDKGFNSEWADSTLVNKLVKNNCRMIGFPSSTGGEPDNFNNFVLQIGNMIDCSAPRISRKKRELIVYPEQIRNENEYAEVIHNTYCLDFPNRIMTQGWLVFPQKNESLELEGLTTAVDSMLIQVKFDNTLLSNSLARAFDEVGTHRYRDRFDNDSLSPYPPVGGYTPCYPYFGYRTCLEPACTANRTAGLAVLHTGLLSACQSKRSSNG